MAKHRKQAGGRAVKPRPRDVAKHRRVTPSVVAVGTTAAGLSTALIFGHATNTTVATPQVELAAAAIGIGGRDDPDAAKIPLMYSGQLTAGLSPYIPVHYPATFFIDSSVAEGVPTLEQTVRDNKTLQPQMVLISYSEGTVVAEEVKRRLAATQSAADTPPPSQLSFIMLASPNVPNGGIYARLPGLQIPFFVTSNGVAEQTPYSTTYYTKEYDPFADFPAYFNPLSLLNSLVAVEYVHPDQYYEALHPGETELVKTVTRGSATDKYVFVPADQLPLLAPVRQVAALVGLTPLTEPFLSAIEPLLRLGVDMGYTDRENLNPEAPVQFSFITPPEKVLQALAGVPGAIEQGVQNFVSGVGAVPSSVALSSTSTMKASTLQAPAASSSDTPSEKSSAKSSALDATPAPQTEQKLPAAGTPPKLPNLSPKQRPLLNKLLNGGGKATPGGAGPAASTGQQDSPAKDPAKESASANPPNATQSGSNPSSTSGAAA